MPSLPEAVVNVQAGTEYESVPIWRKSCKHSWPRTQKSNKQVEHRRFWTGPLFTMVQLQAGRPRPLVLAARGVMCWKGTAGSRSWLGMALELRGRLRFLLAAEGQRPWSRCATCRTSRTQPCPCVRGVKAPTCTGSGRSKNPILPAATMHAHTSFPRALLTSPPARTTFFATHRVCRSAMHSVPPLCPACAAKAAPCRQKDARLRQPRHKRSTSGPCPPSFYTRPPRAASCSAEQQQLSSLSRAAQVQSSWLLEAVTAVVVCAEGAEVGEAGGAGGGRAHAAAAGGVVLQPAALGAAVQGAGPA